MSKFFEFIKKYDIYIILILVLLLYFPVFFYNFLNVDDIPFILNNQYLNGRYPINFFEFFIPNFITDAIYTPFTFIIYWLIIKLFGNSSFVFHFVNVFFYSFSCVVLLFLLKKILKNDLISFLATILYVIHPCHVEYVVWIAALGYNISSLFFFLSFKYFISVFDENKNLKYIILFLLFYALAILSQPIAITLPVILFIWVYFCKKDRLKESIKYFIPTFFIAIIYVYISHSVMNTDSRFSDLSYSFLEKIQILGRYLFNSFLSFQPMSVYPLPSIYFLIPVIIFFIVFIFVKKDNLFYFWILWYIIAILPYSSLFFNIEVAITDRYLMLSSVATCVALSYLSIFIFNKVKNSNVLRFFFPVFFFIFYLIVSILYIPIWKNDDIFCTYAYNLNPNSYRVMQGFSYKLIREKKFSEALYIADKMIKDQPKAFGGYNSKIISLIAVGNLKEALDLCFDFLKINPNSYNIYMHMFRIYFNMNDYDNAEKSITTAEELHKKYNRYKEDYTDSFRDKKVMLAYCKVEPNKIINELKSISDSDVDKLVNNIVNLKYAEKENLCLQYLKNSKGKYNYNVIMLLSSLYMENKYCKNAFDEMKKISVDMSTATSMVKSNKLDEAEKIYLSVIDRNKYILNAYLSLGYIYLRMNNREKALNILNRALEINPYDEKAKDMLKYIK